MEIGKEELMEMAVALEEYAQRGLSDYAEALNITSRAKIALRKKDYDKEYAKKLIEQAHSLIHRGKK